MTREQAESIAGYLRGLKEKPSGLDALEILRSRRFLGGIGLGVVFGLCLAGVIASRGRRRNARAS